MGVEETAKRGECLKRNKGQRCRTSRARGQRGKNTFTCRGNISNTFASSSEAEKLSTEKGPRTLRGRRNRVRRKRKRNSAVKYDKSIERK